MNVRYHHIAEKTYVDGQGCRTALFMQGCPIQCVGCQNAHLWDPESPEAHEMDARAMGALLWAVAGINQRGTHNVTISGGEPFFQPTALAHITCTLKALGAHVVVYSGYTFEYLWHDLAGIGIGWPAVGRVFSSIDVLVDGPFVQAQDNAFMQYRGSANQRVIDVPATIKAWYENTPGFPEPPSPVLLDWDKPEVIITPEGDLLGAVGLIKKLGLADEAAPARRCGQTK